MKNFLLLILATGITYSSIGQHILLLKSGEKMNGKVERFRNDTLTFNFKGNKMLIKSSDISAIYFEEKNVPKEEKPNPINKIIEQQQEGKISGVVTYYFNDNYGDKPDVGTEVLILDAAKVPNLQAATVDSFIHAKTYKGLYNSYSSRGSKIPDNIQQEVKAYSIHTQEGFENLDNRANEELYKLRFENAYYTIKLITDGNGGFAANVPSGEYYIYLRSNHRKGKNITEILGQVYFKKVQVKSGETVAVNAKFSLY